MAEFAREQPDLSVCDREPIHIPGAIQPHGVLLALSGDLQVRRTAGDLRALLGFDGDPLGQQLGDLIPMS
jgi:light-regulated signal transduction histidine kinase (bacteriophytochrome)